MENCYCGSDHPFEECCRPFIEGVTKPQTAQSLMRSRYSAYVLVNVEYILRTTHPSTRKLHNAESIREWAAASLWQKLEIISTDKGTAKDSKGTVEFKAYYLDPDSEPRIHHELSNFAKELGKWFFVDGEVVTA